MKPEKSSLVVKSNRLIEASYRLSMMEMQLVLMAISQARETQTGFDCETPVTINVADFEAAFNRSNAYMQLREALDILFDRYVSIDEIDAEGNHWVRKTRWISEQSYCDGLGSLKIVFAQAMKPYITRLEQEFTNYRIQQIGDLSSVYAVRFYEFLVQFKNTGVRTFEIERLRDMLGLIDEYKLLGDFKKWVIDVAVEQINEYTDLKVSYTTRKTGRRITHLDFSIKEKSAIVSKRPKLDKGFIDKNALPGESYEQAASRLRKQRDIKQEEKN
jgi:plasmid replication initiation protein